MPGRIFISYSKADPEPTRALADFLTAQGYSVWWDTNLTSGEVFREVIDRELAAADAVIVIWSEHSVASNWVVSEADDAARRGKLITVRAQDLEPWRIPKPYNTYHTDIVDNRDAVLAAVRRVAGEPQKPEVKPSPSLSEATLHEALALEHWQLIKASADPAKLRAFINEFGATKSVLLAKARLEELAGLEWQKCARTNDRAKLETFARHFSGTPQARSAETRLERIAVRQPEQPASSIEKYAMAIAVIWFITMPAIAFAMGLIFRKADISFLGSGRDYSALSGWMIGVLDLFGSAGVLVWLRGENIGRLEFSFYWITCSIIFVLSMVPFWDILEMPTINGNRIQTGFIVGVIITLAASIAAWRWLQTKDGKFPRN